MLRDDDHREIPGCLATDGFQARYFEHVAGAPGITDMEPMVLPATLAPFLQDPHMGGTLRIDRQGHYVRVSSGYGGAVTVRMLEGRYFAVMDLVPTEFGTSRYVDGAALREAVEACAAAADQAPFAVRMHAGAEELAFETLSEDATVRATVPADGWDGPDMALAFNARNLAAGLQALLGKGGGTVCVELSGPKSLARITAGGRMDRQILLMPLDVAE